MAVDNLRQVLGGILTFSTFIMLGNMIKRDHIDPLLSFLKEPLPPVAPIVVQHNALKVIKPRMVKLSEIDNGPWKEQHEIPRPCWKKPLLVGMEGKGQSNGYIFFSLSHSPEYHASQIANAVAVARHLGATLALPDIRGTRLGDKRHFGEIYDVNKFATSLDGVVRVDKNPPAGLSNGKLPIVRVPDGVSSHFIASIIEPVFQRNRILKIATNFNSSTMTNGKENELFNAYKCTAMFESLSLQPKLQALVDSMVGTLRSLSRRDGGRFVGVDLRVEMMRSKGCQAASGKSCYDAGEIGEFLKKTGFRPDTTIYLTQTGWHGNLNALRNVFPNTFTKEAIVPADVKATFTAPEIQEYKKFIDFYMCTEADVLVRAFPSRFYASVVGRRIGTGKTQILVPANNASASPTDYISPYVAKKRHSAYSCFC